MTFLGVHFCADEARALALVVPGVAFVVRYFVTRWRARRGPQVPAAPSR